MFGKYIFRHKNLCRMIKKTRQQKRKLNKKKYIGHKKRYCPIRMLDIDKQQILS